MKEQHKAAQKARARPRSAVKPEKVAMRPYRPPSIVTCSSSQVEHLIRSWSAPLPGQALRTP